jgi:hypothetical protein
MTKEVFALAIVAICVLAASALAFYGKDGWGWFLFAGVIVAGAVYS